MPALCQIIGGDSLSTETYCAIAMMAYSDSIEVTKSFMSFTLFEARGEHLAETARAIRHKDHKTLYHLAAAYYEVDEEYADSLHTLARRFEDQEYFAYDEHRDNELAINGPQV